MIKRLLFTCLLVVSILSLQAQEHSVAREWNEILLTGIRLDFARPTVHARNLFHTSIAMYDAWAVYDETATPFLLGQTIKDFTCPFDGVPTPDDVQAAREEAISYAMFRIMRHRFQFSPGAFDMSALLNGKMQELGYDPSIVATDYENGSPAALGNYIAQNIIDFGLQDGGREQQFYTNEYYEPVNPPMVMDFPGNPTIVDPNRWQPLSLSVFIDQSGNVIPGNTPAFLSPEWGKVVPFALTDQDLDIKERDGQEYYIYHDPGHPPYLDTTQVGGLSEEYKWGFSLVSVWSSHLDADQETLIDISPASIGNIADYPTTIEGLRDFYDYFGGGDASLGHDLNPATGQPYTPQFIKRADYARVLAEFWADGPDSETPPGHWFTILNYVNDHPQVEKRFRGRTEVLDDLEWDVKAYLILGGAMHDCAVTAWGLKGWYDYIRPVSAIRAMAEYGQSSDPTLPSYHPGGIPLVTGYIELVEAGDPLAGMNNENVGKIKLYAWKGPDYIQDPETDEAGVDWILAANWWPYQRPSFVTPPFAGYVSGHSTFSRAAADILTMLTGDAFFPGGMGEFTVEANEFLVFEEGPSESFTLQWATYQDASDQTSLSRIWGGIHPPADDIPGRLIGAQIGLDAFNLAENLFYRDTDQDGYFSYEDCDDQNANVYPGAPELCDEFDNDCNGFVDDEIDLVTYYLDADQDGFGDAAFTKDTCGTAPVGYVNNSLDCNDALSVISPNAAEICDNIDNDCNGFVDDELPLYTYYRDIDEDGFGNELLTMDTCQAFPPPGFVVDGTDCDDNNADIFPFATDIPDNGIDEDCSGIDLFAATILFPNPVNSILSLHYQHQGNLRFHIYASTGKLVRKEMLLFENNASTVNLSGLNPGVYFVELLHSDHSSILVERIIKL